MVAQGAGRLEAPADRRRPGRPDPGLREGAARGPAADPPLSGCSPRRSPSIAARRSSRPPTSATRRPPASSSGRAATHTCQLRRLRDPRATMVFDINDFDEVSVAPFEWDLKRLAASFVVAAAIGASATTSGKPGRVDRQSEQLSRADRRLLDAKVLDTWYASVDLIDLHQRGHRQRDAPLQPADGRSRAAAELRSDIDFAKLAVARANEPRIKDAPPLIFHLTEMQDEEFQKIARDVDRRLPRIAAPGASTTRQPATNSRTPRSRSSASAASGRSAESCC